MQLKRYRYTGKERDEETGLNYHGARYYAPWLARWCAVDPMESKYGGVSGYNYCLNNPVMLHDMDGMEPGGGDKDKPRISTQFLTPISKEVPVATDGPLIRNEVSSVRAARTDEMSTQHHEKVLQERRDAVMKRNANEYQAPDIYGHGHGGQREAVEATIKRVAIEHANQTLEMIASGGPATAVAYVIGGEKAAGITYGIEGSLMAMAPIPKAFEGKVELIGEPKTAREYQYGFRTEAVAPTSNPAVGKVPENVAQYSISPQQAQAVNPSLTTLQMRFEALAEAHLLPQYREIDPNLEAGYTGSFKTGVVGNRTKSTHGQPINLSEFDIDFWIKSDILYSKFGDRLQANPEFRQILAETPGFEGLRPNRKGFTILFKPVK